LVISQNEKVEELKLLCLRGKYREVEKGCRKLLEQDISERNEIELQILLARFHHHYYFTTRGLNKITEEDVNAIKATYEKCKQLGDEQLIVRSLFWYIKLQGKIYPLEKRLPTYDDARRFLESLDYDNFESNQYIIAILALLEHQEVIDRSVVETGIIKFRDKQVVQKLEQALVTTEPKYNKLNSIHLEYRMLIHRELWWGNELLRDYEASVQHLRKAMDVVELTGNKYYEARQLWELSTYHLNRGEHNLFFDLAMKSLEISKELNNQPMCATNYGNIGIYYHEIGEKKEMLEYSLKAYNTTSENGTNDSTGYMDNISLAYVYLGELDKAMEVIQKAIKIRKKKDWKYGFYSMRENLGYVYQLKGDLNTAQELLEEAGEFFKESSSMIAYGLNLLLRYPVYLKKGLINKAIKTLEESLDTYKELKNPTRIIQVLFHLITVTSKNNMQEYAERYQEQLVDVVNKIEAPKLKKLVQLTKGMLQKNSDDPLERVRAKVTFEQMLQEDLMFHIEIEVLFQLCELLLAELKLSGSKKTLEKLRKYVDQLVEISTKNNLVNLIIESLWFKAQILYLEEEFEEAKKILAEASTLAEEKGYITLAQKINTSKGETTEKLLEFQDEDFSSLSIENKIEILQIEERFREMQEIQVFDISDLQFKSHF